ncbi:MAG: hypothetical protein HQ562_08030 [Candidatus Marinimicrobia bacterium]|nr:hypothetical protein [Candidatus Neomarinimicrobiota bacterium]
MIQAKESPEIIRKAEEIKLRAERRAGELLKDTIKPGNPQLSKPTTIEPSLKDLGITRDQSSRWQQIASIPEEGNPEEVSQPTTITTRLKDLGITKFRTPIDWSKLKSDISTIYKSFILVRLDISTGLTGRRLTTVITL